METPEGRLSTATARSEYTEWFLTEDEYKAVKFAKVIAGELDVAESAVGITYLYDANKKIIYSFVSTEGGFSSRCL